MGSMYGTKSVCLNRAARGNNPTVNLPRDRPDLILRWRAANLRQRKRRQAVDHTSRAPPARMTGGRPGCPRCAGAGADPGGTARPQLPTKCRPHGLVADIGARRISVHQSKFALRKHSCNSSGAQCHHMQLLPARHRETCDERIRSRRSVKKSRRVPSRSRSKRSMAHATLPRLSALLRPRHLSA